jgi:16S rRNA (uracil1498-N3)-methyltransferase
VEFSLGEFMDAAQRETTTLLIAIFKYDRLEWALEKATELGVTSIQPVIARRTAVHLAQAAEKRVERWRRLVHEAAQQSRQTAVPEVRKPLALTAALREFSAQSARILLAETERDNSLWNVLQKNPGDVSLAIGPEGGWADDEMKLFEKNGWQAASLGTSILRAETAAIAALAVVQQARLVSVT